VSLPISRIEKHHTQVFLLQQYHLTLQEVCNILEENE